MTKMKRVGYVSLEHFEVRRAGKKWYGWHVHPSTKMLWLLYGNAVPYVRQKVTPGYATPVRAALALREWLAARGEKK